MYDFWFFDALLYGDRLRFSYFFFLSRLSSMCFVAGSVAVADGSHLKDGWRRVKLWNVCARNAESQTKRQPSHAQHSLISQLIFFSQHFYHFWYFCYCMKLFAFIMQKRCFMLWQSTCRLRCWNTNFTWIQPEFMITHLGIVFRLISGFSRRSFAWLPFHDQRQCLFTSQKLNFMLE